MTVTASETNQAIKRCAVCKIDLKGRFVFVDEQVEEILGQSMEQLFGKPIEAFLDAEGQRVVKGLLDQHSRYETSYDSCRVNLVNSSGAHTPVNLIFSLCFAAGNPVNYQIVINKADSGLDNNESHSETGALSLIEVLSKRSSPENMADIIPALVQFVGEPRIAIYQLDGDDLTPLPSRAVVPITIEKVSKLHLDLAKSNKCYCFDDQSSVRKAVELTGKAPAEYVRAIKTTEGRFLLRVVLDEELSSRESKAQLKRVRLSADLVAHWFTGSGTGSRASSAGEQEEDQAALDLRMADLFGVAAMTLDHTGAIVSYNSTATGLVQTELDHCSYRDLFVDRFKPVIKDDLPRLNLFVEQAFKTLNLPRFESAVLLRDSRVASLSLMRSDPANPQSDLLMLVIPIPEVADAQTTRRTFVMAQSSFDDLQSLGRIASDYTSKLSHEYFSRLDGDGNFILMCLASCLDKMMVSLSGYKEMFQLGTRIRRVTKTDLNVLMNELACGLGEITRNVRINISHSDLPKIQTDAHVLKTVLRLLLAEVLCEWNEDDFKISVVCKQYKTQAKLKILLPSNSPRAAIYGLNRLTQKQMGSAKGRDVEPNPLGLAVDHLLNSLGAIVEIDEKTPAINILLSQSGEVKA